MRRDHRVLRSSIFLILLLIALPIAAHPASGQENPVASLDPVQGLVQLRPAAAPENDWRTLTAVELVEAGDWVRTDSLGVAVLTFFEGVQSEILPNSQVTIGQFEIDSTANTFQITLEVSVGDMHNQINQVLDPNSRYEVHTPSAVIAVRGTDYWVSSSWLSEALINVLEGVVQTFAVLPDGRLGNSVFVNQGQSVMALPSGDLSAVGPLHDIPEYPPRAPLAPATCGNNVCEPGEETICPVDCQTFPSCGNNICELNLGEGPVTCAADCVPESRFNPQAVNPSPDGGGAATGGTGEPCTVQTTRRDVPMRVGPGFNRGVRDYLTPNVVYPVLGDATANDGSLWWQIEVPNVPQAWALQDDVMPSGDCDVPDAEAPPFVPAAPPPTEEPPPDQPAPPEQPDVPMSISFYASPSSISYGQCAIIRWDVEGIKEVYFEGVGVTGHESREVCPYDDTTYTLRVITRDNRTIIRTVTVIVDYY